MKRIRQFFSALLANISSNDVLFACEYLDKKEQKLFFGMSKIDQAHALKVAKTARKIATNSKEKIDIYFLTRVALLHDIGRRKGDLGLFGKVFAVLLDCMCHKNLKALATRGKSKHSLWHFLYVYKSHAEIGAGLLQEVGSFKEADIISKHHLKVLNKKDENNLILTILRQADEEN